MDDDAVSQLDVDRSSVAAVIVTFNRREILGEAIESLRGQTQAVDEVVVVDNASSDGTREMLAERYPDVTLLSLAENEGPGAAFAVGMRHAHARGHRWAWLFNDDDRAKPEALDVLLGWADRLAPQAVAMIGCWNQVASGRVMFNGSQWRGRHLYVPPAQGSPAYRIDVLRFSGTLVALDVVPDAGVPRSDYFFMIEEVEYCLRVERTGRTNFVVPQPLVIALHEGSPSSASPPWRGYYQTRNHLAMALEHRSAKEVAWCLMREAKFTLAAIAFSDQKWRRACLRAIGAWHAIVGKSGKTLDPATDRWRDDAARARSRAS
jgi:GT2 family glycosyltransferase